MSTVYFKHEEKSGMKCSVNNKLLSPANTKRQSRRQTMTHQSIASLQDGEELYEAVGDDPAYFEVTKNEH